MAVEEINNNFSMAKSDHEIDQNHEPEPVAWDTWEELLLAYAVNRYGTKSWDSISTELKKRTTTTTGSILFTPVHCEQKFDELKHRFNQSEDDNNNTNNDVVLDDDDTSAIPWLDELRKQRVLELERRLKNYDLYISSLQLKVKKLTEQSEKETELGHGIEGIEIGTDEGDTKDASPKNGSGEGSGDGESVSDRDNQSVNGSNGNVNAEVGIEKVESEPGRTGEEKGEPVEPDLSNNNAGPEKEEEEKSEPDERTESMAESKSEGGKNSDVQSSASKSMKENCNSNRVRRGSTVIKGGDEDQSTDSIPVRSLPLVDFLQKVHKLGSVVFERRLDRQEKLRYKNLIRQPIDYEILQTRLKEGWYSDGNDKFFRDLFLLVSNSRIFFPKESPESVAAADIRQLVLKEMISKKKQKTDSKLSDKQTSSKATNLPLKRASEPADSLLLKPKLAGPIVVCRKRSSITAKAAGSSSGVEKRKEQTDSKNVEKLVEENRDTTPKRSRDSFPIINKKKGKSVEKPETSDTKPDKKKKLTEAEEKKQSAAKFLNRMKRSSNEPLLNSLKERGGGSENDSKRGGNKGSGGGGSGSGSAEAKKDQTSKKTSGGRQAKEQGSPAKRSVGRPPKRAAAPSPLSASLGKRNRELADSETLGTKQTKKRSKR